MPITEGGTFTPHDRIVSPGVFSRENDLSGLAQGVADIGGAIVAPFPKGPGFAPTVVTSVSELEEKFGVADGVYYGPYTAKQYLQEQGLVTVCRVGALTGYKQDNPFVIYAIPGYYTRNTESGSFTSLGTADSSYIALDPDDITVNVQYVSSSTAETLTITGSLYANFETSSFATYNPPGTTGNKTYTTRYIGDVNLTFNAASFEISSSYQGDLTISAEAKLLRALAEQTGRLSGSLATTSSLVKLSDDFPVSGDASSVIINSINFAKYRPTNSCGVQIQLTCNITGSFGKFTAFTENVVSGGDPCNPGATRESVVLAVLANTQNATIQSDANNKLAQVVYGFEGSVFSKKIATSGLYSGSADPTAQDYVLDLRYNIGGSSGSYGTYEFSLDPASSNYITNVFGSDATAGDPAKQVAGQKIEAAYLYNIFKDTIARIVEESTDPSDGWMIVGSEAPYTPTGGENKLVLTGNPMKFTDDYGYTPTTGDSDFSLKWATTPWINSQQVAPFTGTADVTAQPQRFPLFRIHTLADGTNMNTSYKIEISDVKLAGTVAGSDWGSFTLAVRKFSDTDKSAKYLERFQNLNLDPDSSNFIARRIGDRYNYISYSGKIIEFGTYSNLSKYVRIEMTENVYPTSAIPYGFDALATPVGGTLGGFLPPVQFTRASTYSTAPGKYPSGIVFGEPPVGAADDLLALYPTSSVGVYSVHNDNLQYFAPLPAYEGFTSIGNNVVFDLEEGDAYSPTGSKQPDVQNDSGGVPSTYDAAFESTRVKMRKFVLGFQGGFDGQSPAVPINVGSDIIPGNTQGLNCTSITTAGSIAYRQCIGALGNADEFDINLIVTPGIFYQHHSYVAQLTIDMCEARGDCFYIMDNVVFPKSNQSTGLIDAAVNVAANIDSSYVATYYPWVKILDTNLNKIVSVPPSVVLPAIYASNDKASAEWFAPAGLNRGGITQAVQVLDRLTHSERDTLYEGRVNPIAAFPGQGICVWGQKTLQIAPSALDRINVRRLMINLKKFIASSSRFLVFEQNVANTRNRFLSIVNPYLEQVQQRSGLYAFQVKMDETNNTPDLIDRNILYGQIYLQPTKTAEFIVLDFNILPTGAQFPGA
jgi:hypothetical protein